MKFYKQLFFILFINPFFVCSQTYNNNYFDYHTQINKAETFLLKENNLDSCFYYYDKAFKEFDFIFVKDLVNAAQIAKLNNRDYEKYIIQGFKNGLKINHLESYPIFKDVVNKLKKDKQISQLYNENRKVYLKRIDLEYLNSIYDFVVLDQKYREQRRDYFNSKISYNLNKLSKWINTKGFPSDKLLGISDSTIFRENKSLKNDIISREQKTPSKFKFYTSIKEESFSQYFLDSFIMTSGLCFFKENNKDLLLKEIKKGNLHPKDVAYFCDAAYFNSKMNGLDRCGTTKVCPLFTNTFDDQNEFNIYKANEVRREFYIIDYEIDKLKEDYQAKNNLRLFSGNHNQR